QQLVKAARKDTAAYASLPLSTMSKSKIPRHKRRRTEPHTSHPLNAPRSGGPVRPATTVAAVDEPYLVNARPGVNSIQQEFASSRRNKTAAAQAKAQHCRSQK
ncbi:hypothetical protein, partial [Microvirga sp.]|uniref:hypothetical protein n=1 Tax=Microvirga sp. TaxID=1873136 RepID=UPI001AED62F4